MDIDQYMAQARALLLEAFPGRLVCLGLQGSCARGEATEESDIDLVVILDRVEPPDVRTYRWVLDQLPARERSCGFFSGRGELTAWDRGELFQFYYDTRPYAGDLEFLRPLLGRDAAAQAVRAGAGAIYHGCVHNLLHTESTAILRELYKAALFVLRARVAAEGGPWCPGSRALEERVAGPDREILRRRQALRAGRDLTEGDLVLWSETLMAWAGELLRSCPAGGEEARNDTKPQ